MNSYKIVSGGPPRFNSEGELECPYPDCNNATPYLHQFMGKLVDQGGERMQVVMLPHAEPPIFTDDPQQFHMTAPYGRYGGEIHFQCEICARISVLGFENYKGRTAFIHHLTDSGPTPMELGV